MLEKLYISPLLSLPRGRKVTSLPQAIRLHHPSSNLPFPHTYSINVLCVYYILYTGNEREFTRATHGMIASLFVLSVKMYIYICDELLLSWENNILYCIDIY